MYTFISELFSTVECVTRIKAIEEEGTFRRFILTYLLTRRKHFLFVFNFYFYSVPPTSAQCFRCESLNGCGARRRFEKEHPCFVLSVLFFFKLVFFFSAEPSFSCKELSSYLVFVVHFLPSETSAILKEQKKKKLNIFLVCLRKKMSVSLRALMIFLL